MGGADRGVLGGGSRRPPRPQRPQPQTGGHSWHLHVIPPTEVRVPGTHAMLPGPGHMAASSPANRWPFISPACDYTRASRVTGTHGMPCCTCQRPHPSLVTECAPQYIIDTYIGSCCLGPLSNSLRGGKPQRIFLQQPKKRGWAKKPRAKGLSFPLSILHGIKMISIASIQNHSIITAVIGQATIPL